MFKSYIQNVPDSEKWTKVYNDKSVFWTNIIILFRVSLNWREREEEKKKNVDCLCYILFLILLLVCGCNLSCDLVSAYIVKNFVLVVFNVRETNSSHLSLFSAHAVQTTYRKHSIEPLETREQWTMTSKIQWLVPIHICVTIFGAHIHFQNGQNLSLWNIYLHLQAFDINRSWRDQKP